MTEEVGFDRPDAGERCAQIVRSIAFALDTTDINDNLPDGIAWMFDEVGPDTSTPGRITISGWRDRDYDDGVEVVLQIKRIDFGPHRLTFEEDDSGSG